jgi:hypothetical protein
MHNNARVLFACLSLLSATGYAQSGSSSSSSSSSSQNTPKGGFVRRFSAGVTLGVYGMPFIKANTTGTVNGSITKVYDTTSSTKRIGYGLTGQIGVTRHIAVNVSALVHRVGFQLTTTTQTSLTSAGVTTITTTSTHEDTRANAFEFPVAVRYYFKDRYSKGPHFFAEGGAVLLKASSARSNLDTTNAAGTKACCTSIAPDIQNRSPRGFLGGLGIQFIDPIGIRVVPEVRYIRWQNEMFHNLSTFTQKHQIEAVVSLTF